MDRPDEVRKFYVENIPGATLEGNLLKAACPLCPSDDAGDRGTLVAYLDAERACSWVISGARTAANRGDFLSIWKTHEPGSSASLTVMIQIVSTTSAL